MPNAEKTPESLHFYNPLAMEIRGAEHLFGIPCHCGYEWVPAGAKYDVDGRKRGSRERILFKYTISGQGELTLGGMEKRALNAGDAMLLCVPGDYRYRPMPGADHWEFLFFTFDSPVAVEIAKNLIREAGNTFSLDAFGDTPPLAWQLYCIFQSGEIENRYQVSALGYDLLMHLYGEALAGGAQNRTGGLLHRVSAYCFRHLSRPVTVEELADVCGYSRWHFSRIFREASGMTPSGYILEQKLTAACRILQHENVPVKELADRCGFVDPGYFGRRFRRRFGVTPTHYDNFYDPSKIR